MHEWFNECQETILAGLMQEDNIFYMVLTFLGACLLLPIELLRVLYFVFFGDAQALALIPYLEIKIILLSFLGGAGFVRLFSFKWFSSTPQFNTFCFIIATAVLYVAGLLFVMLVMTFLTRQIAYANIPMDLALSFSYDNYLGGVAVVVFALLARLFGMRFISIRSLNNYYGYIK